MKLTVNGKEQEVSEVDFDIGSEHWNEYKLLDGGTVRVRIVVSKIYRVFDDNGKESWNQDGSPNFAITSTTMVVSKV